MAVSLKKLLQCGPDVCKLGTSPTMVHSYSVYTFRMKMIVATNTWAAELSKLPDVDRAWLEQNGVYVLVESPLWMEDPDVAATPSVLRECDIILPTQLEA